MKPLYRSLRDTKALRATSAVAIVFISFGLSNPTSSLRSLSGKASLDRPYIDTSFPQSYESSSISSHQKASIDVKRPSTDPVIFSITSNRSQVTVGEEIELSIKARYLHFSPTNVFTVEGSDGFTLRTLIPSYFEVTGGTFTDYVHERLSSAKPEILYTLRGYFTNALSDGTFKLLRSKYDADATSIFTEKAKIKVRLLQDVTPHKARLSSQPVSRQLFLNIGRGTVNRQSVIDASQHPFTALLFWEDWKELNPSPNSYNWTNLKSACDEAVARGLKFAVTIYLWREYQENGPQSDSYLTNVPGALNINTDFMRWQDGSLAYFYAVAGHGTVVPSPSSEASMTAVSTFMQALGTFLAPYGDNVLYVNSVIGENGELAYPWFDGKWSDFSEIAKAGFRTWLTQKYSNLSGINSAWGTSYTSVSDIQPTLYGVVGNDYPAVNTEERKDWMRYRQIKLAYLASKCNQGLKNGANIPYHLFLSALGSYQHNIRFGATNLPLLGCNAAGVYSSAGANISQNGSEKPSVPDIIKGTLGPNTIAEIEFDNNDLNSDGSNSTVLDAAADLRTWGAKFFDKGGEYIHITPLGGWDHSKTDPHLQYLRDTYFQGSSTPTARAPLATTTYSMTNMITNDQLAYINAWNSVNGSQQQVNIRCIDDFVGGNCNCTPPTAPQLSSSNNSICSGNSATLTASGCNGTVNWSTGQTGTQITVNAANTYTATCVVNGCSSAGSSIMITNCSTTCALTKVRLYPRSGLESRLNGAKVQGSNNGQNGPWTDVLTVSGVSTSQWYEFTANTAYSTLRLLSPNDGYCNVAEVEFYNGTTKLQGTPFGDAGGPWGGNQDRTFDKAFDGNIATFYDASNASGGFTGLVLTNCNTGTSLTVANQTNLQNTPNGGGNGSFAVNSINVNWAIGGIPTWINLSTTSGSNGTTIVNVTFQANAGATRSTTLTVNGGGFSQPISLSQQGTTTGSCALTKVRLYPRSGLESRLNGAKVQGSNNGQNGPWTDVLTVSGVSTSQWYEFTANTAYSTLRLLSPNDGYCNVAEVEFYNGTTKLQGTPFGDAGGPWGGNQDRTFDKAFDGNIATFYDASNASGGFTGLVLTNCNTGTIPCVINKARLQFRAPGEGNMERLVGAKIQASNDQTNWIDLYTFTSSGTGSWQEFDFSNNTPYQHVRFVASPNIGYGELYELEFYNGSTRLMGAGFGTSGVFSYNGYEAALDGNTSTQWHGTFPGSNNYAGLHLTGCQ